MSVAAVSTAGATPDAMLPSAAMIISCRPFEKRRVAPYIPAILQLPLKCEGRGVRYGATDTPLWLEAAVWLEGRSGRLAGGKSSPAAKERAQRRTRDHRETVDGNIRLDGFRLDVWRLLSMLIFGQVAGQARWRRRPHPKLLLSASHPIPNRQAPALDLTSPRRPPPPVYHPSRQQQSSLWHEEHFLHQVYCHTDK